MEQNPLISIVTPSLNQARFIGDIICSVLGQTYPYVEHVIVDGGSTDGTLDILREYDERIRWLSEPDNGQGDAVNKGFALARGEIIAWINADDFFFSPHVFEHIVEQFKQHQEIDMIYGGIAYVDVSGRPVRAWKPWPFSFERLKRVTYIQNSNAFFRRRVADRHQIDSTFRFVLDHEFFLRVAADFRVMHTDALITCFRIHPDALTPNLSLQFMDDERRRRDEKLSIRRDNMLFRLLKLYDWSIYRFHFLKGYYWMKALCKEGLPYQRFIMHQEGM